MSQKPRVLLAMIETGGGHKSTARAIDEAINDLYPGEFDTEVVDFAHHVGALKFDEQHKKTWDQMLRLAFATRIGYEAQDAFGSLFQWGVKRWAVEFFRLAAVWFLRNDPEIFVATHWLNSAAAIYARQLYPHLKFRHIHFLTEPLDSSAIHHWKGADYYLVGSGLVERKLLRAGIDAHKITVVGYPVRKSFFEVKTSEERIRSSLGLEPGRLTILLSAGAAGVGKMEIFAKWLSWTDIPVNLVVVCGHNEVLREYLSRPPERTIWHRNGTRINVIPLGFMPNINEILSVADLTAIKAGPASTFEALFMHKPILFFEYVARHEKANIDMVISQGAGWYEPTFLGFRARIEAMVKNRELVNTARENTYSLDLHNGSEPVARFIHSVAASALNV